MAIRISQTKKCNNDPKKWALTAKNWQKKSKTSLTASSENKAKLTNSNKNSTNAKQKR